MIEYHCDRCGQVAAHPYEVTVESVVGVRAWGDRPSYQLCEPCVKELRTWMGNVSAWLPPSGEPTRPITEPPTIGIAPEYLEYIVPDTPWYFFAALIAGIVAVSGIIVLIQNL